jgi:curved DNA-binding protein CbpA
MAVTQPGGAVPDLYQLLGVAREASGADIAHAYRRKARAMHPDSRPQDTGAPARFRALAGAYQVLSDPGRRAAYDRALRHETAPAPPTAPPAADTAAQAPLLWPAGSAWPGSMTPPVRAPGPPLWAGPVRVDRPDAAPDPGARRDERARLALIAELVSRYLDDRWYQPW